MILRPPGKPGSVFFPWLVMAVVAGGIGSAAADPLDQDSCRKLQAERQGLAAQGVDKNLEKGADWAKANLKVGDIILVKRYLDIYEQLKFRCEKVIALDELIEGDDDKDEDDKDGKEPAAPARKDAASIEQVSPESDKVAKPAAVTAHGMTVSAQETKGDLQTKPAVKEAKPAAKDVKAAAKDTKTAKDTKPKAAVKSTAGQPAEEQ